MIRIERIKQAQEEESWIANLKEFLIGDITKLSIEEAKLCARIAFDYEVDETGLLFFCPRSTQDPDSRVEVIRWVVPELLQQGFLHQYHTSLDGGHQGIGRTYQRIRSKFHWRGLYRSVQRYVEECVDCTTGIGTISCTANRRGIFKPRIHFRYLLWTISHRCRDLPR